MLAPPVRANQSLARETIPFPLPQAGGLVIRSSVGLCATDHILRRPERVGASHYMNLGLCATDQMLHRPGSHRLHEQASVPVIRCSVGLGATHYMNLRHVYH